MKKFSKYIIEKLKITNKSNTTIIPNTVSGQDNYVFNKFFSNAKLMANHHNLTEKDDLQIIVDYLKKSLPKDLQTKEKIWAYISCTLGFDYMFDDESIERFDAGYLHPDFEDGDPIYELAYRAVWDK